MTFEENLERLGLTLPPAPPRGGVYTPIQDFGENLLYASGFGPAIDGLTPILGKVGKEVSLEDAQEAARRCTLNLLAALKAKIGDLSRVKRIVKLLVFVASDDEFYDQPQAANGASRLFVELFGEEVGLAARSAVGMNVLPGNIPVEVEAVIELKAE